MKDRELDALIAEKVMGWSNVRPLGESLDGLIGGEPGGCCEGHSVPRYSTDIAAAWQVVEKIEFRLELTEYAPDDGPTWMAKFMAPGYIQAQESDDNPARAICLAALKAVGVEGPMSLDVYLSAVRKSEVFSANIAHNLKRMAAEAGLYEFLWRPEEVGVTKAAQLIEPLRAGLARLRERPGRFTKFNPENGWGSYEGLVRFVELYLAACEASPEADV